MSAFYTIKLRRQHIVSQYDKRGNLVGTTETMIEETHTGLPAATVEGYRSKFPDAVVSVTQEFAEPKHGIVRSKARTTGYGSQKPRAEAKSPSPAKAPAAPAHVGTYGDLVNKLAGEAA